MDVSRLEPVYESDGPFATVLLDVGRGTESGAHEVHSGAIRAEVPTCFPVAVLGTAPQYERTLSGR